MEIIWAYLVPNIFQAPKHPTIIETNMIFNNISLSSSVNVTYTNSVLNSGNIQFTVYFFKGKVQKYRIIKV